MLVTVAVRALESFRLVKRRFVSRFKLVAELVQQSISRGVDSHRGSQIRGAGSADLKKLNFKLSSTAFLVDHPSKPVAMSLAGLRYQAYILWHGTSGNKIWILCVQWNCQWFSMSGNSGPRFEWSLPRSKIKKKLLEQEACRSQIPPPLSVCVLKPERHPSEDEGE